MLQLIHGNTGTPHTQPSVPPSVQLPVSPIEVKVTTHQGFHQELEHNSSKSSALT